MQAATTEIVKIELGNLHPHPKNANVMSAATMKKLRRHLEKTNRYEPLVVRPHPTIAGGYELINGHHRKEVLQSLGHTHANCIVWNLSDAETLLLLATINRLGGEDAPSKRLDLLETLAAALAESAAGLADLLPEDAETLESLLEKCAAEPPAEIPEVSEMPEAFMVFLTAKQKRELTAALANTDPDPAVALLRWMRDRES